MKEHRRITILQVGLLLVLTTSLFKLTEPLAKGVALPQEPSIDVALDAQARQLNREAQALLRSGDLVAAIETFKQASELFERARNREGVAVMFTYISLAYQQLGDWVNVLGYAKQARQHWRASLDRKGEVEALKLLSLASEAQRNYKDAFAYLTEAISLLDAPADRSQRADLLVYLGGFYRSWGDDQKSIEYFQHAVAIRKIIGPRAKEARALVEIARSYRMSGMNTPALEKLTEAFQLLREDKDSKWETQAFYEQGQAYHGLSDDRKAVDSLEQALRRAHEISDYLTEALCLRSLGLLYSTLGDRNGALENLRHAIALSEQVNDPEFKAHLLCQAALSYSFLGEYKQSLDYYGRALELYKALDHKVGTSIALAGIGLAHEMRGEFEQALTRYYESIAVREEIRNSAGLEEIQLVVAGQSAEVYQLAIHLSMHLRRFRQAFELSERARARNLLDQLSRPRIDLRKGADPVLIDRERALFLTLDDFENRLRAERAKPISQTNSQTVRLLDSQLKAKQQEYANLRARLRAANPETDSLRNMSPLTLSEVQRLLDTNTTLVSYFVTYDKTIAFIITRDAFQALEIPVEAVQLTKAINLYYDSRDNLNDTKPRSVNELYRTLIEPLRPHLKTAMVGIIPHGILHYLPFAALNDGQNYLGDKYALFYLPSASVVQFVAQKRKQGEQNLLALAQDRVESLPVLAYANQSAEAIARLYHTRALIGSAATESAFRARASTSRTLFLAAHGVLSSASPLFSRIYLAPDKANDGILEVHEVYDLDLAKADLVVLSGCQTQVGQRSQGDDIIGLNRAFIYAGTPTVVASLWSVPDKETAELMVAFFKHLKNGKGKAEALRAAQREIRVKYPHPYYWAAFVLTGDPGRGTQLSLTGRKKGMKTAWREHLN